MKLDPVLLNDWHAVARSADLPGGKPIGVRLLDTDVVVWRAADGRISAWKDQCPHRGTQLSIGKVVNDTLVCAYHAWAFDPSGQCVHMPAQPDTTPSKRARVQAYHAKEKYGLVWVCVGEPGRDIFDFPEYDTPNMRRFTFGPYRFNASGPRIVENFLDMAHFPFVHAGFLGASDHTEVPDYTVSVDSDQIVLSNCKFWQPAANPNVKGGSMVDYTYWVKRPLIAYFSKTPAKEAGGAVAGNTLAIMVTPVEEFCCDAWKVSIIPDHDTPDEDITRWNNVLIGQDVAIVESQRPKPLSLDIRADQHQRCDHSSIAYRRWLKEKGLVYGVIND